jgi:hypothetical protein
MASRSPTLPAALTWTSGGQCLHIRNIGFVVCNNLKIFTTKRTKNTKKWGIKQWGAPKVLYVEILRVLRGDDLAVVIRLTLRLCLRFMNANPIFRLGPRQTCYNGGLVQGG